MRTTAATSPIAPSTGFVARKARDTAASTAPPTTPIHRPRVFSAMASASRRSVEFHSPLDGGNGAAPRAPIRFEDRAEQLKYPDPGGRRSL